MPAGLGRHEPATKNNQCDNPCGRKASTSTGAGACRLVDSARPWWIRQAGNLYYGQRGCAPDKGGSRQIEKSGCLDGIQRASHLKCCLVGYQSDSCGCHPTIQQGTLICCDSCRVRSWEHATSGMKLHSTPPPSHQTIGWGLEARRNTTGRNQERGISNKQSRLWRG